LEARLERLLTSKGEALSTHLRLRHDKASVVRNTRRILDETERIESLYAELLPILCGLDSVVYDPTFTAASAPAALLALFFASNADTTGANRKQNGSQSTLETSTSSSSSLSSSSSSPMSLFQSLSEETMIAKNNVDAMSKELSDTVYNSTNKGETVEILENKFMPAEMKEEGGGGGGGEGGEINQPQFSTTHSLSIEESTESKSISGSQLAHSIIEAARARARLRASSTVGTSSSSSSVTTTNLTSITGQSPPGSHLSTTFEKESEDDDLIGSLARLSIPSLPLDPSLILSMDALLSSRGPPSSSLLSSPSSSSSSSSSSSTQNFDVTAAPLQNSNNDVNDSMGVSDSTAPHAKQTTLISTNVLSSFSTPSTVVVLDARDQDDDPIDKNNDGKNEDSNDMKQTSLSSSSSLSNIYISSPIASAMHAARVELGRNADHSKSRAKEVIDTLAEISAAHKERIAPAALLQQQLEAIRAREAKSRHIQSLSYPSRGVSASQLEDENSSIAAMLARVASAAVAAASVPVVSYTSINSRQGDGKGEGGSRSQQSSPKSSPSPSSYERQRQSRMNNTANPSGGFSSQPKPSLHKSNEWTETNLKKNGKVVASTSSSSSSSSSLLLSSAARLGLSGGGSSSDATPLPMSLLQSPTSPSGPSRAASPTAEEDEFSNGGGVLNINHFNGEDAAEHLFSALLYQAASRFDESGEQRNVATSHHLPVDGDLRDALLAANSQFDSLNFAGEVYRNSGNDNDDDDDGDGNNNKMSPRSVRASLGFYTPLVSAPPLSRSINGRHVDDSPTMALYKISSPTTTSKRQQMRPPFDTNLVVRYSPSGKAQLMKPLSPSIHKKRSPVSTVYATTETVSEEEEEKNKVDVKEDEDEEEEEDVQDMEEKNEALPAPPIKTRTSSKKSPRSRLVRPIRPLLPQSRKNQQKSRSSAPIVPVMPVAPTLPSSSGSNSRLSAGPFGQLAEVLAFGLHDHNRHQALDSRHLMRARLLKQQQMAFRSRMPPPGLLVRQQQKLKRDERSSEESLLSNEKEEHEGGGILNVVDNKTEKNSEEKLSQFTRPPHKSVAELMSKSRLSSKFKQ